MSTSVWGRKSQGPVEEIIVQPIEEVHVDAAVLMRIVKHTQECVNAGTYSVGYILGLDIDGRLEVTESVPLPPKHDQEDGSAEDGQKAAEDRHQREMLESLIQVTNFDNYHVGLYHSTYMGYFYADGLVDILLDFQKREELSKNTIALMYDPFQTSKGDLYIRAFRLSQRYLQMRESGRNDFMPASEILESLPVKITCNSLATGFVRCIHDTPSLDICDDFQRLEMSADDDSLLIRYVEEMAAGSEELMRTQFDFQRYSKDKAVSKQRQEHIAAVTRRKKLNEERKLDGEPLLPETLEGMGLKPLPEAPPRLYTLLANAQLDQYAHQTEHHVEDNLYKLYATRALHTAGNNGR